MSFSVFTLHRGLKNVEKFEILEHFDCFPFFCMTTFPNFFTFFKGALYAWFRKSLKTIEVTSPVADRIKAEAMTEAAADEDEDEEAISNWCSDRILSLAVCCLLLSLL